MKFTAIALVASASAMKIQVTDACIDAATAKQIFEMVDANGNGQVSGPELFTALKEYAASEGHEVTAADKEWVTKTSLADAGADKTLSQKEFGKWINSFAAHFKIDGCGN